MLPHGYEEIEHTADLAIKVWGEDFFSLLRQAAIGLYDLMDCEINPDTQVKGQFHVAAGESETILVDFLGELLYLSENQGRAFKAFEFNENEHGLWIQVSGYEISSIGRQIKAVTFHDLDIHTTESGLEATITFDV